MIRSYRDFIGVFLYFLRYGGKPAGMAENDFRRTKEIIIDLVENGHLKEEALKLYE